MTALHTVLSAVLEDVFSGVSTGPNGNRLHLKDTATVEQQATAETIAAAHNQLAVLTNKATIDADDSDTATITCNDAAISADATVDYTVWLDGQLYSEGVDSVATGAVVLTLQTNLTGTYVIEIRRQSGNYASGYVEVIAE